MIIHSRDPLTIQPAEILQTAAVMTIFGGTVIYEREAQPRRSGVR